MISVLRLSHRIGRDIRLTSHLCLCARAFLCDRLYYSGQKDASLEKSIKEVVDKFGGGFGLEYVSNAQDFVLDFRGVVVHLTMYGGAFLDKLKDIKNKIKKKDLLIVVGGPKVEGWVYGAANYNLSVTSQPISEVGALSVFLHELHDKGELGAFFKGARIKILPCKKGKIIEKR